MRKLVDLRAAMSELRDRLSDMSAKEALAAVFAVPDSNVSSLSELGEDVSSDGEE